MIQKKRNAHETLVAKVQSTCQSPCLKAYKAEGRHAGKLFRTELHARGLVSLALVLCIEIGHP